MIKVEFTKMDFVPSKCAVCEQPIKPSRYTSTFGARTADDFIARNTCGSECRQKLRAMRILSKQQVRTRRRLKI